MSNPTTPVDSPASHSEEEVERPHLGCQAAGASSPLADSDDDMREEFEDEPEESPTTKTVPEETELSEEDPTETEPLESDPSEEDPTETEPIESDPSEEDPDETEPLESDPSEDEYAPYGDDPPEDTPVDLPTILPAPEYLVVASSSGRRPRYGLLDDGSATRTYRRPAKRVRMPDNDPYSPITLMRGRVSRLEDALYDLERRLENRVPSVVEQLQRRVTDLETSMNHVERSQNEGAALMTEVYHDRQVLTAQFAESLSRIRSMEERILDLESVPEHVTELTAAITRATSALLALPRQR